MYTCIYIGIEVMNIIIVIATLLSTITGNGKGNDETERGSEKIF